MKSRQPFHELRERISLSLSLSLSLSASPPSLSLSLSASPPSLSLSFILLCLYHSSRDDDKAEPSAEGSEERTTGVILRDYVFVL